MKLLLITQKVDTDDPILGFFHEWIVEFAKHYNHITVLCLQKGSHDLPQNVTLLSLGKEEKESRFQYITRFYTYLWNYRSEYNAVYVHMNQEYVLLGGFLWRMFGKKVTLWRNHHAGNFLTNVAVFLCNTVFCTSKYSYTARFKKTVLMPVGINTELFKREDLIQKKGDILFLARIALIKKPHILIEGILLLRTKGLNFTLNIYGNYLPQDASYYAGLKKKVHENNLDQYVQFIQGIPNKETVAVYNEHKVFVNLTSSGSYDKTIFEAAACETLILVSNKNLIGQIDDIFIFEEDNIHQLAQKLEYLLGLTNQESSTKGKMLRKYVEDHHNLRLLGKLLNNDINQK